MTAPRRFAVLQLGARMHYAVPALLASAGLLDTLYTDIHAGNWPARLLGAVLPDACRPRALKRLLGRRLPAEIPPSRVRAMPFRAMLGAFAGGARDPGIARLLIEEDFGSADALYAFSHGHLNAIRAARERGLFIAFEQVIGPTLNEYLREERDRFPGLEPQESPSHCAAYIDAHREIWEHSDLVLAPSEFVASGIEALGGAPGKIRLVPYGIPESLLREQPQPTPGRVLFVGQPGLRKGSHYLAEAARILKARRVPCQIRVVGEVPPAFARNPLFDGPDYAGQVPRGEVLREFLSADVFALPSLAEGSATAHLEALACGLPVIATPNAGTVVRHETEGLLVPIRDPLALADAIERIVTDRPMRERMSQAARARAASYTWPHYGERLLSALGAAAEPSRPPSAAIVWRHLGPYHAARARAVSGLCDLTVLELAASERGCGWSGDRPGAAVRTLTLSSTDLQDDPPLRSARRIWNELGRLNPRSVFIAGYGEPPFLAAALWCRLHRRRSVLFSETTPADRPRRALLEILKGRLVRTLFDRAIVGGKRQKAYLESLGFTRRPIDGPYNVVDNDYFRAGAAGLRRTATPEAFGLPTTAYFLYVGRLAPEKNLELLLRAYAAYAREGGAWDLVLAGDGPLALDLHDAAAQTGLAGRIHFTGARSGRDLLACYAFAGCFLLPSLSEPWGLVLNEAMAAGLPLLVSDRCGSLADLVEPGRNAFAFDPRDEHALAASLSLIAALAPEARSAMGAASSTLIQNYSLEAWASAFARALEP